MSNCRPRDQADAAMTGICIRRRPGGGEKGFGDGGWRPPGAFPSTKPRNSLVARKCEMRKSLGDDLMSKPKPPFSVVGSSLSPSFPEPPGQLGSPGLNLWRRIQTEYRVVDSGGVELLFQICGAADRLAEVCDAISRDGVVIATKNGLKSHPALRDEVALRSFIARSLARMGLNLEPLRSPGRPASGIGISWRQLGDR